MANTGTKTFVKVLKILFSIFLSFIFITTAFVLPIYYSVAGIFTPKTVSTVVQNIDFAEMINDSEKFNNAIKEFGIEKESVNEIMQSNEFGAFLESCTSTVMDAVFNNPESLNSFDPAVLKDIIDNHAADITNVLQEKLNLSIKKEDVQSTMHKLLENNSDQIKESIASLAPDVEGPNHAYKILSFIQTTLKLPVILLFAFHLASGIFASCCGRFCDSLCCDTLICVLVFLLKGRRYILLYNPILDKKRTAHQPSSPLSSM